MEHGIKEEINFSGPAREDAEKFLQAIQKINSLLRWVGVSCITLGLLASIVLLWLVLWLWQINVALLLLNSLGLVVIGAFMIGIVRVLRYGSRLFARLVCASCHVENEATPIAVAVPTLEKKEEDPS